MSKPKIHLVMKRDPETGEIRGRCGKWLLNPAMQSTTVMEDVTCPRCKSTDHPAYEDYLGDGTDKKMEAHNG